jgi:hypothetical protein
MVAQVTKLKWFDAGVEAFSRQSAKAPQSLLDAIGGRSMYVCPLCLQPFPREAVADGELTAEHVPPDCFGGRELILTCKKCNNTAGSKLDAHAERKEGVEDVLEGRGERVQDVRLFVGDVRLNAELTAKGTQYSVRIPEGINPPGAEEKFQSVLPNGAEITVEFSGDKFADLGAKISWLRSGYLLLFAVFGYSPVFDSALDVVRCQILEPDLALMRTFTIELPERLPWADRKIVKVDEPAERRCWAVQFGRYLVVFPLAGDKSFYERLGRDMAGKPGKIRGDTYEWPERPLFGLGKPVD